MSCSSRLSSRPHLPALLTTIFGCALTLIPVPDACARRIVRPPPVSGSFIDELNSYDTTRWTKADGWTNGAPFDNVWRAVNITHSLGIMDIQLDDNGGSGEPYASGNYQSIGFYGYGCYEAAFKPVAKSGVISSFFTFAGPFDNGGNGSHNEIDIEFVGEYASRFQVNWWANDDAYSNGHEHLVDLGFNATEDFHRYGFKWTSAGIEWFVDGEIVYGVLDSSADPTPKATESLHKMMTNVWPVDNTAAGWAGAFNYPDSPLHGRYDWVRHIAGEDCSLAEAPELSPPPPPPTGKATDLNVKSIYLRLNSRGTQAIAEVVVENGQGGLVEAADVYGSWSGSVSSGDTHRITGPEGDATFYSARMRSPGRVEFCVTNVSQVGMVYKPEANKLTCAVIGD